MYQKPLTFLFVSAIFGYLCHGFTFTTPLLSEVTVSWRPRYYCEHLPNDGFNVTIPRLFPGSTLFLVDECLECKCTMSGLTCKGIGHNSGVVAMPSDCKQILDGCQALLVKISNASLNCYTGEPIDFQQLAQQLLHSDNIYSMQDGAPYDKPLSSGTELPQLQQLGLASPYHLSFSYQSGPGDRVQAQPNSGATNLDTVLSPLASNVQFTNDSLPQQSQNEPPPPQPSQKDQLSAQQSQNEPQPSVPFQQIQTGQYWHHDLFYPWMFFK